MKHSSQGPYSHSKQSDPPSSFSIGRKNPFGHLKQAVSPSTQYNSNYQPFSDDHERNSLLVHANAALSVDKQLSSGFWACYKCYLYYIIILCCCYGLLLVGFIALFSNFSLLGLLIFIQILMQMSFAVIAIDALKHKKLDKAQQAFKLAIAALLFIILNSWALGQAALEHDQATLKEEKVELQIHPFFIFAILFLPQHLLMTVIPAWRLKLHIERREAGLRRNSDIYNL